MISDKVLSLRMHLLVIQTKAPHFVEVSLPLRFLLHSGPGVWRATKGCGRRVEASLNGFSSPGRGSSYGGLLAVAALTLTRAVVGQAW